jgi:hypothetical protein
MRMRASSGTVVRGMLQSSTPMERTYESGRHVASLRVAGLVRFAPAAFLAFWLCGWAVGEAFAGGALVMALLQIFAPGTAIPFGIQPPAPGPGLGFMIGFLALWLTLWTFGGIAAFGALLQVLFARERLSWDAGGVRIERSTLWSRSHEWTADAIEGFFLKIPGGNLEIQAGGKRHLLLSLGTPEEKKALRDELRALFVRGAVSSPESRELPKGWESWLDADGATVLARHRGLRATQTRVIALLFLGFAAVLWLVMKTQGLAGLATKEFWVPVLLFGLPLAAGLAWLGFGGSQIRIRSGVVEFRRWFFGKVWSRTFRPTSLELSRRTDSDNDAWFSLEVREGNRVRRVHSEINELENVLRLARWLSAQTGIELRMTGGIELDP